MIFAVEEIAGPGESFADLRARKRSLFDALEEIAVLAGDVSHVSGPADYLIRLTTAKWLSADVPTDNAFFIVDNVDNIALFEMRNGGELESLATISPEEDWFEEACEEFRAFRERSDE